MRPDFEYNVDCGYLLCDTCHYPYYPMEAADGDICMECESGMIDPEIQHKHKPTNTKVHGMTNAELQLGDVIFDPDHPENGLTMVQNIKGNEVTLHRPYPHCGDVQFTFGVLIYTGVEIYKVFRDDSRGNWKLVTRKVVD